MPSHALSKTCVSRTFLDGLENCEKDRFWCITTYLEIRVSLSILIDVFDTSCYSLNHEHWLRENFNGHPEPRPPDG